MIKTYLSSRFKLGKLSSSWIIQTDDLVQAVDHLKCFINDNLLVSHIILENNPDFRIVEKQSNTKNISIDQLRELQEFLNQTSVFSKYKVAIIYHADLMNLNAANSCLKILEDTPKNTYIFLITTRAASLLPTIRSRCTILNFYTQTQVNPTSNYLKSIELLTTTVSFDKKLSFIKELSEKNRELWVDFADSAMQLLVKLTKKSSNIQVDLNLVEDEIFTRFKSKSPSFLIEKFENIKKLIDNTIVYDLDLRSSFIVLLEHFKNTR